MTRRVISALTLAIILSSGCSDAHPEVDEAEPETVPRIASSAAPPAEGEIAPDFVMLDTENNQVRLHEVIGDTPTVLVFYRGHW